MMAWLIKFKRQNETGEDDREKYNLWTKNEAADKLYLAAAKSQEYMENIHLKFCVEQLDKQAA